MWMTWRCAMHAALYGPAGFYTAGDPASCHFRTSVHASPRFAGVVLRLAAQVDTSLGHPPRLDLVDVGAGRGELLGQVLAEADASGTLAGRLRAHAVEVTPRPRGLDPRIRWHAVPPSGVTGLVVANEWLDNIPLDVAELTADGPRLVLVDPATGAEQPGPRPGAADLTWLRRWWPLAQPGDRAEIGRSRCQAWAGVVGRLSRGLAVAADYCHDRAGRPPRGTLAGYRRGRAVLPIPDGSCDVTAHVALDACAQAGRAAGAAATVITTQREALRSLGVTAVRPPLTLAASDPARYARALGEASQDAELIDRHGLGGFGWLVQTAGMALPAALASLGEPRMPPGQPPQA